MGFVLSFESLKAWCQRQNYQFRENTELGQLAVAYRILDEDVPLMIIPELARGMVMLAMKLPFNAPAEQRASVIETAMRMNASSFMGTWVVNSQTGEIFFRVTVPALDTEYSDAGLLHVARVVVGTTEKAAPDFKASVASPGQAPSS